MHSDPQELAAPDGREHGPQQAAVKPCDSCSMCCKLLHVTALNKPQGRWCVHHAGGKCGIHAVKPFECSVFQCFWTVTPSLGEDWRPDRAKLILWSDGANRLIVEVDSASPQAWRREPYYSQMKTWASNALPRGGQVVAYLEHETFVILPNRHVALGVMGPQDQLYIEHLPEGGWNARKVDSEEAEAIRKAGLA